MRPTRIECWVMFPSNIILARFAAPLFRASNDSSPPTKKNIDPTNLRNSIANLLSLQANYHVKRWQAVASLQRSHKVIARHVVRSSAHRGQLSTSKRRVGETHAVKQRGLHLPYGFTANPL